MDLYYGKITAGFSLYSEYLVSCFHVTWLLKWCWLKFASCRKWWENLIRKIIVNVCLFPRSLLLDFISSYLEFFYCAFILQCAETQRESARKLLSAGSPQMAAVAGAGQAEVRSFFLIFHMGTGAQKILSCIFSWRQKEAIRSRQHLRWQFNLRCTLTSLAPRCEEELHLFFFQTELSYSFPIFCLPQEDIRRLLRDLALIGTSSVNLSSKP